MCLYINIYIHGLLFHCIFKNALVRQKLFGLSTRSNTERAIFAIFGPIILVGRMFSASLTYSCKQEAESSCIFKISHCVISHGQCSSLFKYFLDPLKNPLKPPITFKTFMFFLPPWRLSGVMCITQHIFFPATPPAAQRRWASSIRTQPLSMLLQAEGDMWQHIPSDPACAD